jgi:hypothetical protein
MSQQQKADEHRKQAKQGESWPRNLDSGTTRSLKCLFDRISVFSSAKREK